ncbi:hypothetical protein N0V84_005118 [Fusarium piperis]|uniref:Uncharacterized protein n=1 Tax=Fusarium piperis TaxID=1435070 RepID=A0A9W8WEB2_9HYPO|nr:hypothetical protein N0V84_005118 [Fusarium piperis]
MDCPKNTSEAKAHIAHIRREKGLDGPEVNTSDLDAALVLLSEQLYQKSTHFLLELLQNADDNTYSDVCPTLQMTYTNGKLQVSCNEVGFQRPNTEAICRIGRSTKSGPGNATRYIGEKGIGFKSVFKVTNVAWIHSGFYSFKFDKREKLGMIAPIWAKFPGLRRDGFTSILLDMEPGQHHSGLLQELRTFDPRLLIFLRKLKKIDISILEKGKPPWKTTLARGDDNEAFSKHHDLQRLSLCRDSEKLRFVVTRHSVTGLPDDPKRPGCTDSEILLAFPTADDGSPCISSQHVYAFLPIRDYGFKFLLQADFLLIASREDIDSSSSWNTHLYNAVPAAVLNAVQLLHQTELKYSWPQYLASRGTMADFFEKLETRMTTLLSQNPVLESMTGDMVTPNMLTIITEDFMDNSGLPLTLSDQTAFRYLSSQYSTQVRDFLKKLGVGQMDHAQFFDHLRICFLEHNFLENKKPEWHSCLARRLIAIISQQRGSIDRIHELPIIPLEDGKWTNAKTANILFPSSQQHLTVPFGIQVHQVHRDASEDVHRRQLLVLLGVQPFDASKISEIIAETHTTPRALDEAMAGPKDIVQHGLFIFHAKWTDPKQRILWFLSEDGVYRRANELYVGTGAPFFVANVLDDLRGMVNFLHPSYEEQIPEGVREKWAEWLANNQKMNRIPRLARPSGTASFTISAEFHHLITTWPPTRVLYLLKSNWTQYGVWIEDKHSLGQPIDREQSRKALIQTLSSMEVECRGGRRALLKDTILPLDDITKDGFDIQAPILDLPDTKAGMEWDFLRYFGVGSKNVMEILVKNLKSIRENEETHTTEEMAKLYGEMQQCKDEKGATEKLRLEFKNGYLIFIPPRLEHDEMWVSSQDCLWTAPGYIKKTPHLSNFYPELENFFRDTVRIQDMDVRMLLREMYGIQGGDSLEDISQLFIALTLHLRIDTEYSELSEVRDLCQQCIFPIEKAHTDGRFETLQKAEGNDIWFIADRPHLWKSFTGHIPLLAFSVDTIARLESMLDLLPPLRGRLLSANVKGVPLVQGSIQFHKKYTDILRSKVKFVSSLIPTNPTTKKDDMIKTLRKLEVFEAEEVNVEWTVKLSNGRLVKGRADPGRVKLASDPGYLAIYLTKADLDNDIMPVELSEELCKYCGITGASEGILLQQILMSHDHAALKQMVERRGLVIEQFDDDLDDLTLLKSPPAQLPSD